jgi:isoleucyl-tRNA synthetase
VDPWEQIAKHGIDPIRWYLFVASLPGMPKRYDEKALKTHFSRFFATFGNSFRFLDLYAPKDGSLAAENLAPKHMLDQWILARSKELTAKVTALIDDLQVSTAARLIEEFMDDLSNWYLRRSRDRVQEGTDESRAVLASVLLNTAKLCAPFIPIFSERIYLALKPFIKAVLPDSVHLCAWPESEKLSKAEEKLLTEMAKARELVAEGLKQRMAAGLKVRQPLAGAVVSVKLPEEMLEIVREELNLKRIQNSEFRTQDLIKVDMKLTPELELEGQMRELVRHIQIARKDMGLTPQDKIALTLSKAPETEAIVKSYESELKELVRAESLELRDGAKGTQLKLGNSEIEINLKKI